MRHLALKFRRAAVATTLLMIGAESVASAYSVGNGGAGFPQQYNSSLPTLSNGQYAPQQADSNGRQIMSPQSFPSVQPVSAASPFPVTIATTLPVAQQGPITVNGSVSVNNFSASTSVYPNPASSPFPIVAATTLPVAATITNFPPTQPVSIATTIPVACVSGCSSGSGSTSGYVGQYNTTLPTYTNGQTVIPQYDSNGRQIMAPFTINVGSLAGTYNSTLPTLNSGSTSAFQLDVNGLLLLSPQNNIQVGPGKFDDDGTPLTPGQVSQVRVNRFGETIVAASTPLPITVSQTGALTDRHEAIHTASTSQILMPLDNSRHGFMVQNNSANALWINVLGTKATGAPPDFQIPAGSTWTTPDFFPAYATIFIYGTVAGSAFSSVSW